MAIGSLLALLLALPAGSFVPPADKVSDAVARANRRDGRAHPLRLQVQLERGEGEVLATGELVSGSSNAARLELRGTTGLVERHLRRGSVYRASRNGASLPSPQLFLPPLFWLQTASGDQLRAALVDLGALPDAIALGSDEGTDCYVLGAPSPYARRPGVSTGTAFWVGLEGFEPVRIDLGGAVRYRLGPVADFGALRLPSWIAIQLPDQPELRLVVREAGPADVTPAAFDASWLGGPEPLPGGPERGSELRSGAE